MCLFVLSKKDEPNLVVKTVSAAFQDARIHTMFISNPDNVGAAMLALFLSRIRGPIGLFAGIRPFLNATGLINVVGTIFVRARVCLSSHFGVFLSRSLPALDRTLASASASGPRE